METVDLKGVVVQGLTPVHYAEDIDYWKLGIIVFDPNTQSLTGGMAFAKSKDDFAGVEKDKVIDIQIKRNKTSNTIRILDIKENKKQKSNKIVNNIEDPF